ncbi:hypothetical protein KV396_14465 [Microbacterium galbinum]|uniref:Uncharacterized protein n=1 Tax=Microbacterium galbinum TaxID=2851646 RepID=A0ABY4IUQ5_9MICO|nr:hypothetical protein KV396_14465 [Microbacterium galbinum]
MAISAVVEREFDLAELLRFFDDHCPGRRQGGPHSPRKRVSAPEVISWERGAVQRVFIVVSPVEFFALHERVSHKIVVKTQRSDLSGVKGSQRLGIQFTDGEAHGICRARWFSHGLT